MNRIQLRMTRMAMLAVCSAALTVPFSALAQDTPPPPPAPAAGQDGGGPGGGHEHMSPQDRDAHQLKMMTKHLELTDDQQAQIKKIFADSDSKMMALHDDTATPRDQKRPKMMQIMQDRQTAVRAVLTADQQTKYDVMMQKMKEHEGEHHHGGPGGDGPGGGGTPPPPPPQQ
jgi:Spy/CpxP family protein refolding chaperone